MSNFEKISAEATAQAKSEATFIALGKHRRELVFLGSGSEEEADAFARDGVLQSKYADTFVIPVSSHYNEQGIRWANPDGVEHRPASLAPLNPDAGEQELSASEKLASNSATEVSKRELTRAQAESQIASGESVNTGEPDKLLHQRTGGDTDKTSAFDGAPGAKGGEVSSSEAKGTAQAPKK